MMSSNMEIKNNNINNNMKHIYQIISENKTPFFGIMTKINENNKKEYVKLPPKNYNTKFSFDECMEHFKNINFKPNQLLFKIPENYIVIDTDEKDIYKKLKHKLKEMDLYNEDCITKSFSGKELNLPYKRHFWFKINTDDADKYKKHFNNPKHFKGFDVYYDCWAIAEFTKAKIEDALISILDFDDIKNIIEVLGGNLEPVNNNNNANQNIYNNTTNNEELITIMNHIDLDDFETWRNTYFIFINENLPLNIFHEYSKKSHKYDEQKNNDILKSVKPIDNGLTIKTLYYYLQRDNNKVFLELQKKKHNILELARNLSCQIKFAEFYYDLEPNKYKKSNLTGWYEYNKNNILISRGTKYPKSLLNDFSSKMQHIFHDCLKNLKIPNRDDFKNEGDYIVKKTLYEEAIKTYTKALSISGHSTFCEGCIKFLEHLYTDDTLDDKLDSNNNLIAFDDKVYDIKINGFRNIEPTDYITLTCKRNAPINKYLDKQKYIKQLLYNIFENNEVVEYWLKIIGLSLFTNKYESLYILTGKGGNGKGLLFDLLKNCIGDYYYQAENTFLTGMTKSGNANPTLAGCKGVRILSVSEPNNGTETCALNCDFIKSLTGRDVITTRKLFCDNIKYTPQFNVFLQCNDMPCVKKLDNGMTRRLKVINYPFQFVENPINPNDRKVNIKLKDEFKEDNELQDAFIQLLFKYAHEHINEESIIQPESVKESLNNYIEENNPIKTFLEETFIITKNNDDRYLCSEFTKLYNSVMVEKLSPTKINKDMTFNGFEIKKSNGLRYYCGLKLKENETEINPLDS